MPGKKTAPGNDQRKCSDPTKRSRSVGPPRFRLTRSNRLADSASFSRVFEQASKSRDNLFTVLSRENGTDRARLGLAISRKHCRRATGRNRLKRLVRESFRQHAAELVGLDIVVLGQAGTSRADNRAVFESLAGHWRRTRSAHPAVERRVDERGEDASGAGTSG